MSDKTRRYKRMKQIHETPSYSALKPYTPEEALALIIDLDMGKDSLAKGSKVARR